MTIDRQTSIALLREELEQQRTRAEAAEAELRELRKLVDAWKAAEDRIFAAYEVFNAAEEALRHA
jgi:hypothetical protein